MAEPTLTFREYDPENGSLLGNISVLNFGRITAGTSSRVKVIDVAFSDVTAVDNIKLGLISNGNITVNPSPSGVSGDTAANGQFGIEQSSAFNASKASVPLTRHFKGLSDGTSGSTNNVEITKRSSTITNYIYVDVEIGSTNTTAGNGAYKIFFDYS